MCYKNYLAILLLSIYSHVFSGELSITDQELIQSQFFTITYTEFSLNSLDKSMENPKVMGGGSFSTIPHDQELLLYATADGIFYKVNIVQKKYEQIISIPNIDLGLGSVSKSKYLTGFDTLPRVLDVSIYNNYIYCTYNYFDRAIDRMLFKISRIKSTVSEKSTSRLEWEDIYTSPPLSSKYFYSSNGGKMQFQKNLLYFTVGDQDLIYISNALDDVAAQNPLVPWGKVMVLDLDSLKSKIFSFGHRNQQGLLINSKGIIYASEHGPRGGDELNIIRYLNNYGWPFQSYGTEYDSYKKLGFINGESKFTQPIFVFTPAIAPSQLIESINFSDEWKNNLILGSLKAMTIFRIVLQSDHVLYIEPIYIGKRIRDLKEVGNSIILLTDDKKFIKLTKSKIDFQKISGDYSALNRCAGCHNFGVSKNINAYAPTLSEVWGRTVGSTNFMGYSKALKSESKKNTKWTEDRLIQYLKDPQKTFPGTSMLNLNLEKEQITDIVKALKLNSLKH